jgi:hypothetical protein
MSSQPLIVGLHEPTHEDCLGLIKVALLGRDLSPVAHGFVYQCSELPSLLLIMLHNLCEVVAEVISMKGQVEPILVGELSKSPSLVFLTHIQERLKQVRRSRVILDQQFQPDQWSGGHLDELPLDQHGLVGKSVDVAIGRMADMDYTHARLCCQAAIPSLFEGLSDFGR